MKVSTIIASIFLTTLVRTVAFAQSATHSLNDGWVFSEDNKHWQAVSLPHTWNTDAYTTRDYKQGKYSYKRTLRLPITTNKRENKQTDRRYFLKLEGASKTSTIYINGKEVGKHRGGYTASVFDLTPFLKFGTPLEDRSNDLLITVDNADIHVAPISADFTFMGGLYRNVKLITTRQQHFSMTEDGSDGIFVECRTVSADSATALVRYSLRNDEAKDKDCYVVHELYASDGKMLSTVKKHVRLKGKQTMKGTDELPSVKNPVLWSPEKPMLYQVKTYLLDAAKVREIGRAHV